MAHRDLPFHVVDVFAESRFAGNQLAVVLNATQLGTSKMQQIAREFNFSETTFLTSRSPEKFTVRIFTPQFELSFAGHPTLGTAYVIQQKIIRKKVQKVSLSLKVGKIPVTFAYKRESPDILWMKQNEPRFRKTEVEPNEIARALGIDLEKIDTGRPIEEVSTGLPFIIVPLRSLKTLRRCTVDRRLYSDLVTKTEAKSILVFSPEAYRDRSDFSVRVFTEYLGISEDPATGSGNGCLAAYLSRHKYFGTSNIDAVVDQGYEVGRPSKLYLKASNTGKIRVDVGGRVFAVASGSISL
ncbi:MAG: PhzF family phenazine biosynthesis protein [Nitrososphaerota archaeon]|nr:PhzF family phenazine biosynthesis protein [Nitrososphaerota archaeon]